MRSINYPLSSPAAGEKFFNCLIVYFSANARKKWGCGRFFLVNGSAAGVSAARDRRERSPLGRPRVTAVPSGVRAEEVNETQGRVPNRLPVRHRRLGAQPTARAAPSVGCPTDAAVGARSVGHRADAETDQAGYLKRHRPGRGSGEMRRAELQHWAILPCGLSSSLLNSSR